MTVRHGPGQRVNLQNTRDLAIEACSESWADMATAMVMPAAVGLMALALAAVLRYRPKDREVLGRCRSLWRRTCWRSSSCLS